MSEDRLEKAKAVMRERAVTPMMRDALPLASKVQEFFYGIRAEEKHDYATLIELCKGIQDLDQSILALVEEKKPHGDDEKFYVTWLHNFQTDIFRNWVMKLGYEIAELEQATQRFSSRVDLELAEPRSGYGQVKFAYESQLKKAKPLIDQYYDILKLKVFLLPSKRVETLRPPPDEVEQTIAKIDRLKANSIEAIRLSLDRMRELYFMYADHHYAGQAALYAKQSTVYLRWTVIFASLAFTVSLLGLGVQVMQIFSPVNIATDVDKPIHVQGAEAARESDR